MATQNQKKNKLASSNRRRGGHISFQGDGKTKGEKGEQFCNREKRKRCFGQESK